MTARTVTGNTVLLTGTAQVSQTVTFIKRSATISGVVITQSGSTTTTTDASGDFSKALDCPASGSTSWTLVTPDGSEFDFTLPYGDGTSVAVTTLISAPTVDADAVTLLLDGYEPDLGNPGTNGHVLSSTTAGVRSWVAQSGGGAVDSVFGRTGAVVAASGDYNAAQVDVTGGVYSGETVESALDLIDGTFQVADDDLQAIALLTPSNDDVIQRKVGAWTNRTVAQYVVDILAGWAAHITTLLQSADAAAARSAIGAGDTTEYIIAALSDETTAITTGTAKATFVMPYAMTLTSIIATVNTAPTGSAIQVDINEGVSSILSTKLTIDATEKTSATAATPAVISDSALASGAEIILDIDAVGSTVAGAGLKVTLIGTRV